MYVTVWTSSGAIKVALPNNAVVEDLKQALVENLYYVPEKLEISFGGRYVRDDVLIARFPPDTLVAEGPRYDPRRLQKQQQMKRQMELQRQQQEAALLRQQQEREFQERQQQQRRAEMERRARLQHQQQQYVDPISALFGGASPLRGRPTQQQPQPQQRYNESTDEDEPSDYEEASNSSPQRFGAPTDGAPFGGAGGLNDIFGGIFGAPRPRSRATQQQEQYRAQQAQRRQQAEQLRRRQQQHGEEEERIRNMEEHRRKIREQQEAMRLQQEQLAREELELLLQMEEEARRLREKEAHDEKRHVAKEKARLMKKAAIAAKRRAEAAAQSLNEDSATNDAASPTLGDHASEGHQSDDNAHDDDHHVPLVREESIVMIPPHLQRVELDETLHRPQEEQPSPATSATSTPRRQHVPAKPIEDEDEDDANDVDIDNAVTESSPSVGDTLPTGNGSAASDFTKASPANDESEVDEANANDDADDVCPEGCITVKASFAELDGKVVDVFVPPDAMVSDVLDQLRRKQPEATKQGVRIMFYEKYVRKVNDSIRAVPLGEGSAIDVCTGKYLSENEMTLYLADRHLNRVKGALEAHQGPLDHNLRKYWSEQLMKALMLLDSLQEVPDDIRARRRAAVKLVIAEQDALSMM